MKDLRATVATHAPESEGLTMSCAEKLISEGLEPGRAEGKIERVAGLPSAGGQGRVL